MQWRESNVEVTSPIYRMSSLEWLFDWSLLMVPELVISVACIWGLANPPCTAHHCSCSSWLNSWFLLFTHVLSRTLHSPIDSWSFHLESTWTHGVHLESRWNLFGREPSQIFVYLHLDSTWIPDGLHGLHVESFHITLHSIFHLSMDSSSHNNIFCRYWFTNENQVTWRTKKRVP